MLIHLCNPTNTFYLFWCCDFTKGLWKDMSKFIVENITLIVCFLCPSSYLLVLCTLFVFNDWLPLYFVEFVQFTIQ